MTAEKDKRLGFDPLAARERKGMDGLIRDTTEDAHITHNTDITDKTQTPEKPAGVKGAHGEKLPRINMAFSRDNFNYLRIMAAATGTSATALANQIIEEHRKANGDRYEKIRKLMEE